MAVSLPLPVPPDTARLYALAYRLLGSDAEARDCVQDTLVRAHERQAQFRGDAAYGTWLHRICVSIALNRLRSRKRQFARERSLDDPETAPDLGAAETPASDPYLRERLHRAIGELPDGYRTVFLMFDVQGYSHEEIAATLGVTVGTSKAQLFRARARLREAMAAYRDDPR